MDLRKIFRNTKDFTRTPPWLQNYVQLVEQPQLAGVAQPSNQFFMNNCSSQGATPFTTPERSRAKPLVYRKSQSPSKKEMQEIFFLKPKKDGMDGMDGIDGEDNDCGDMQSVDEHVHDEGFLFMEGAQKNSIKCKDTSQGTTGVAKGPSKGTGKGKGSGKGKGKQEKDFKEDYNKKVYNKGTGVHKVSTGPLLRHNFEDLVPHP